MRAFLFAALLALCLPVAALAAGAIQSDPAYTVIQPHPSATAGVASLAAPSAVASSRVLRSTAGLVMGVQVTTGATAGYVLLSDATSASVDGAVTPLKCYRVPATSSFSALWPAGSELRVSTGLVVAFSSTGCFTQTLSATAFISGDVQ